MFNDFKEWLDIFEVIEVYGGNMCHLVMFFRRSLWCSPIRTGAAMWPHVAIRAAFGAWSKLQAVVAFSSAETEHYSMMVEEQHSLAVQTTLAELILSTKLVVKPDSSVAKQSAEKVGFLNTST
jgi:hypothetical protein